MAAALRILFDVAVFRLRRLEMANIGAAVAVAVACRASAAEVCARLAFAFVLNLFVYLNNDWFDLEEDLASPNKDQVKNTFLAAHRGEARLAQFGLVGLLAAFATFWGGGLWWPLVVGGGVCVAYSAALKRHPGIDIVAMILWGAAMPTVGLLPGHPEAWPLIAQLALFSGAFESIQVLRDREDDAKAGVRTTAVVLGETRTRALVRLMLALSAVYAALAFEWWLAVAPALAALAPMRSDRVVDDWHRTRVLLGLTFFAEVALVYMRGPA